MPTPHWVHPLYETPNVPTLPVDHGSAAAHSTVSYPSSASLCSADQQRRHELAFRTVAAAGVLLDYNVASLRELMALFPDRFLVLGIRGSLYQCRISADGVRAIDVGAQDCPVTHFNFNIVVDHHTIG